MNNISDEAIMQLFWQIIGGAVSQERSLRFARAVLDLKQTSCQLRWAPARGETFTEMRDTIRDDPLYQHGDTVLVWVNEGDLHMLQSGPSKR